MARTVKVIEGYPGVGKTAWAIQSINSTQNKKILYITPFLDEVKRIKSACVNIELVDPKDSYQQGGKGRHFIELLNEGKNIIATHELIKRADPGILFKSLNDKGYTLYIDEAQQVVNKFNPTDLSLVYPDSISERSRFRERDAITLLNEEIIKREDDGKVNWLKPNFILTPLTRFKTACEQGKVYFFGDYYFVWLFPEEFFSTDLFEEIFILTHRFDTLLQSYFFQYHEIPYETLYCCRNDEGLFVTNDKQKYKENVWKNKVREHLHILNNPKMNYIGQISTWRKKGTGRPLSKSWYEKKSNKTDIESLNRALANFFSNTEGCNASNRLWTCFKSDIDLLVSDYLSKKQWLPFNYRATNDYSDRIYLAYMINRFNDPTVINFFRQRDIKVNQDELALSDCIQWIWRSAIRNFEDVWIYIPSLRMRSLLIKYFGIEDFDEGNYKEPPLSR